MNQGQEHDKSSLAMEKFSEDKVIPSVLDVDASSLAAQDPVLTARGLTFDEGMCMYHFLGYSF